MFTYYTSCCDTLPEYCTCDTEGVPVVVVDKPPIILRLLSEIKAEEAKRLNVAKVVRR